MTPLFIIPVRGGSKGIPGKNLKTVAGISLVGRAVRSSLAASRILGRGRVVVDSDDEALLAEARRWGAETPFVRPAALATDEASYLDGLRHALQVLDLHETTTAVAVVQATSPLTPPRHLADAVLRYEATAKPVVSVAASSHPIEWGMRVESGKLVPALATFRRARRQEFPAAYELTGAVSVAGASYLVGGGDFFVPGETEALELEPRYAIDIDHLEDLELARAIATAEPIPAFSLADENESRRCIVIADLARTAAPRNTLRARIDAAADGGANAVVLPSLASPALKTHVVHALDRGLSTLVSPETSETVSRLEAAGVAGLVLSPKATANDALLVAAAATRMPLLVGADGLDLPHLDRILMRLREGGCGAIALVQTVDPHQAGRLGGSLRPLGALRETFRVPVGLNDRSGSSTALLAALGLECALWQRPLVADDYDPLSNADVRHAATEFASCVATLREAEALLSSEAPASGADR